MVRLAFRCLGKAITHVTTGITKKHTSQSKKSNNWNNVLRLSSAVSSNCGSDGKLLKCLENTCIKPGLMIRDKRRPRTSSSVNEAVSIGSSSSAGKIGEEGCSVGGLGRIARVIVVFPCCSCMYVGCTDVSDLRSLDSNLTWNGDEMDQVSDKIFLHL